MWNLVLQLSDFTSLAVLFSNACLEVPIEIASFRCQDAHIFDSSSALCLIDGLSRHLDQNIRSHAFQFIMVAERR